ncbi:ornithine cyclodeaminase [Candidatus Omnitrophus magneticus]|uniref:Ornithine cyclodeaminase n=1 Tax=Candidatus Omnitrophus magneticus TaxID=1609969 RepID=A0A0F0CP00_9BACT|nr:ornithine cyclodeaminase [Candidatus Omnitrophus magneticus]
MKNIFLFLAGGLILFFCFAILNQPCQMARIAYPPMAGEPVESERDELKSDDRVRLINEMTPSGSVMSASPYDAMKVKTLASVDFTASLVSEETESNYNTNVVDKIIGSLEFGNIAFNTPNAMQLDKPGMIKLLLSMRSSIEELKKEIELEGDKDGDKVLISNRMSASLTGTNFKITAITPELQAVTGSGNTEWKWEITPLKSGGQFLYLTLTALFFVEGKETPRTIRTFDKWIKVEVSPSVLVCKFFSSNWQWLWTVIVVPAGVLVYKRITSKKK